ncbi:MAG: phenylalanine--tRNA ligase subunit beta [Nitrososphaerales archaeon]
MPVITLYYDSLLSLLQKPLSKRDLIETLPYLGLDLEEEAENHVRVEYNPNRPDFSSEWGVARALNGLLGYEKGAPEYTVAKSSVTLKVDQSIQEARPFFAGAVVRGVEFDDESIKQILAMQDDLDNGIGRRRAKVSTGIHNLDAVEPPFEYKAVPPEFRFTPLGYREDMSMKQILKEVETGQTYRHIVEAFPAYPLITDRDGRVLSFPPIINGETTRVSTETQNLFIDITSTNLKAAEDVLAVLLTALADMGGELESIEVQYPTFRKTTPDLTPAKMNVEPSYINGLLGLNLSPTEIVEHLGRSRITAETDPEVIKAYIPRYRSDILHPVDIAEEVAMGYNIANLTPTLPETGFVGKLNSRLEVLDSAREVLVGLGLIEVMNFSLISRETILRMTGEEPQKHLRVGNPKTGEHEYLRDSLIPTLLTTLSKNIHEEYPQRIFEVGKVFYRDKDKPAEIREEYRVAVAIAHATANYTEARSHLTALLSQLNGLSCDTKPNEDSVYTPGRAAETLIEGKSRGKIGEVAPAILEAFSLRVPASAFELNLEDI